MEARTPFTLPSHDGKTPIPLIRTRRLSESENFGRLMARTAPKLKVGDRQALLPGQVFRLAESPEVVAGGISPLVNTQFTYKVLA